MSTCQEVLPKLYAIDATSITYGQKLVNPRLTDAGPVLKEHLLYPVSNGGRAGDAGCLAIWKVQVDARRNPGDTSGKG